MIESNLENVQAKLTRRIQELALVKSLQQAVARNADLQDIYNLAGDHLYNIFRSDVVGITTFDHVNNLEIDNYTHENGGNLPVESLPFRGYSSRLIESQKTLIINTSEEFLQLYSATVRPDTLETNSGVFVPLAMDGEVWGYITLQDKRQHAYNTADTQFLESLTNSLNVALVNARLLEDVRLRSTELEVINNIQLALASQLEMQSIYELIGGKLQEIFDHSDVGIRIFDIENNMVHFPYTVEDGRSISIDPQPMTDTGVSAYVYRSGKTLLINENFENVMEKMGSHILYGTTLEKSAVYVPLTARNQVYGVLELVDMEREHAFSESDVRLLETLAASLSVALENARLFDETQRLLKETEDRNSELAVINTALTALASEFEFQTIINAIGDQLSAIFPGQDVGVDVIDHQAGVIRSMYILEKGVRYPSAEFPIGKGLISEILKSREPLVLNQDFSRRAKELGAVYPGSQDDPKSWLGVPVFHGNSIKGVIVLQNWEHEHAYPAEKVQMVQSLSSSFGLSLENARLFDETQRLLKETEDKERRTSALFRLSAELADTFDETEICRRVVNGLQDEDLGYQLVTLLLLDEDTGDRVARAVIGHSDLKTGQRFPPGTGLSERPILDGQLHYSPDVTLEESYAEGLEGSEIDVPLRSGDKIIGVLVVESRDKQAFGDEDFGVLISSANQAALAIGRARLYAEAQRQLDELALLNRVISATTSAQDSNSVLKIICRELAESLDAPQSAAAVFDEEHTSLSIVAEFLMEGRSSAIGHRIPLAGNLSTEYVLKHKVPLAVDDVQNDPRMASIQHLMQERGTVSMLILPLLARDEIIGTIGLDFIEPHRFTESEIELAFNVARSTAQSLASARLFEQTNAALAELQRVEESQRVAYDELDHYLSHKIRETIETNYYARVNEHGMLDEAIKDPAFHQDPLNHMALFSDHGVVHVRDVARTILGVLDTVNGVLIPHRERKVLEFMKGFGVMLAYNHDIGMVDFSSKGRAMHPEFAAKRVFDDSFDDIVDTIWNENWGNVAWRLINLVEHGAYEGDPKLMLRELLAMSMGHSKSKVPIEVLNDPVILRERMLQSVSTETDQLYLQQQIKKIEKKLEGSGIENKEVLEESRAELQAAYSTLRDHDSPTFEKALNCFYADFEKDAFTWLTSDQPALQMLTQDVIDTIRALRVADALRQRGSTLKTSGSYPIFIDQNTANAVIALQKGSGETFMFEVDKTHSVGEANLASSEVTLEGNLRLSFQRGSFSNEEAERRAAFSCAMIVEDIQADTIDSFLRPTQPSTQRKSSKDIQILIEETDDSLKFSAMVLEELTRMNPKLGQRCRIVPSLTNVSEEERRRYLTGIELHRDKYLIEQIIDHVSKRGGKIGRLNEDAAFTDVRLIELRAGEILLEIGSPPGFVYLPMGEGLITLSLGGYQPQNAPPWTLLGHSRVIRGAVQEARVITEKDVQLLMIPKAIYLRHWHNTFEVNDLMVALNQLYTNEE